MILPYYLQIIGPSPYMYNITFGEICIIGSNPEVFISTNKELLIKVPIAGTFRHSKTPEKDLKLVNEFYPIRFIIWNNM